MKQTRQANKLKSVGTQSKPKLILCLLMFLILTDTTIANKKHADPKPKPDPKDSAAGPKPDKQDAKKEEKKGPQCNKRLLQTFRLSGLDTDEKAKDMIACGSVPAKNNCCSQTDEIKIIKAWNEFSSPKLDKYADDMIRSYKRVYSLDKFMRTLDAKKGRYHYANYKWHRTAEEKCFDGKYFISKTGLGKLKGKLDWGEMLAEKAVAFMINHVITRIDEHGILSKPDSNKCIVKKFKKDEAIKKLLLDARPGFGLRFYADELEEIVTGEIVKCAGLKMNQDEKKKGETPKKFLIRIFGLRDYMLEFFKTHYKGKNFKEMQKLTVEMHLENLKKALTPHVKSHLDNEVVLNDIFEECQEKGDIGMNLGYMVVPENTTNKTVKKQTVNAILKCITETITNHPEVKKDKFKILVEVLKNAQEKLDFQKDLLPTFNFNLNGFITFILTSHAFKAIAKENEEHEDDLFKTIRNFQFTIAEKKEIKQPADTTKYVWDGDVKKKMIELAEEIIDTSKLDSNPAVFKDIKKHLETAWATASSEIKERIKAMKVPEEKDMLVCATVYNSNLFREIHFNQDKLDYCLKSEAGFKAHKVKIEDVIKLINSLKPKLRAILELKRGFYCNICDKAASPFMDLKKMKITLGQDFCYTIINQYRDYLKWKNVDFTEYILKAHQFLKCFSDDGTPQKMPFRFFEPSHRKELPDVKSCLEIKKKEEVGSCLDMCEKFDYVNYSHFFDGERDFIQKVLNFILNVVRTHGFQFKRRMLEALPDASNEKKLANQISNFSAKSDTSSGLKGRPDNSDFKEFLAKELEKGPSRILSSWDEYPHRRRKSKRRRYNYHPRNYRRERHRRHRKTRRRKKHHTRLKSRKHRGRRLRRKSKSRTKLVHRRKKHKKRRDRGLYENELREINEFDERFNEDNQYLPRWRHLSVTQSSQNNQNSGDKEDDEGSENKQAKAKTNDEGKAKKDLAAQNAKNEKEEKENDKKAKEKEALKEAKKKTKDNIEKKVGTHEGKKAPEGDEKSKKTAKIFTIHELLKALGAKLPTYVASPTKFNEVAHPQLTHNVTSTNYNFKDAVYEVKEQGINVTAIFEASNFDPAVAKILVGASKKKFENFDKHVARALVCLGKSGIKYFNGEFASPVNPAIPENTLLDARLAHSEEMDKYRLNKARHQVKKILKRHKDEKKPAKPEDGKGDEAGAEDGSGENADAGKKKGARASYGKLYRKLYRKKRHRGLRQRHGKNPVMKALIDFLF